MKLPFRTLLASAAGLVGVLYTAAQVPSAPFPDIDTDYRDARNVLVKTMTGIDPLTQSTITDPPYGATGWMQIGADNMVRFDGSGQSLPKIVYDDLADASLDLSAKQTISAYTDDGGNEHQPYVLTVQQRRDGGRCVEPVCIIFRTKYANPSGNQAATYVTVRSMRVNPDNANVSENNKYVVDIPNMHSDYFLIHHTRNQDDIVNGEWSNNLKRNEAFSAFVAAGACDLDGDGYDEIILFSIKSVYIFDGRDYTYKKCIDLDSYCASFPTFSFQSLSYGYNTTKTGFNPHTWTCTTGDFDGDGIQDILALCHTGLYWDHLTLGVVGSKECENNLGSVYSVFIPGGKSANTASVEGLVCKPMGSTPVLPFAARWQNGNQRWYAPAWTYIDDNACDGTWVYDMYHYYHVTLSAEVIYPKGELNSEQPVLTVGWKYLWSFRPTDDDVDSFRKGLTEWYQITAYNINDNRAAFTTVDGGTPAEAARADMHDLLASTSGWDDDTYSTVSKTGWYYYTSNSRASLGAPALKAWYANGRSKAPFIYFAGMSLYYRPDDSQKFPVASLDPLGNDIGWKPIGTDSDPYGQAKLGRICGQPYTMLNYEEIDDDGGSAITDHETLVVPAAAHQRTVVDETYGYYRYRDSFYYLLQGKFNSYNVATDYVDITSKREDVKDVLHNGYNSVFQPVPFNVHTAKVRLGNSYFTASNPVIKAVLAIPPYNTDEVVDATYAQVAFAKTQDFTTEETQTSSSTVGGGFSMGLKLFDCLKMSYSKSFEKEWSNSWAQSYTVNKGVEYSSGKQEDMVLFNYIPVDCFEYEIEAAPYDSELVGETFIFRRALNLLYGKESHVPEVWWTVNDYNTYVSRAGLPRIDRRIFSHTVGVVDSYRRVPHYISAAEVISYFPRKAGGFYAVHDESTAGTGFVTQSLGITQGADHSEGTSESTTTQLGFDFELDDCPFSGSVDKSFGKSKGWDFTTSWAEGISVRGTTPTLIDANNGYTFRQVWYEYADAESGQDFLVVDWAVATNERRSDYAKLELVWMYDGEDDQGRAYYCPQLEWNVVSSDPVECVLEYRVSSLTPDRDYDAELTGSMTLGENVDWAAVAKEPDAVNGIWKDVDFSATTEDGLNHSWRFVDFFSLTDEQQLALTQAQDDGGDVYVYYRVKVYRRDAAASAPALRAPARAADANLLATTNEVSAKLLTGTGTPSAVGNIVADTEAPAEIYTLQGIRVPEGANLAPGIYLQRRGNAVNKVIVR